MTSAEAHSILKEARALMDPDCEANHTLTVSMGSMECVFTVRGRVVGPVSFDSYDLAQAIGAVLDETEELRAKAEPDSWERLRADTQLRPADYLASRRMDPDKPERIKAMMGDLVDRVEALAGAADD